MPVYARNNRSSVACRCFWEGVMSRDRSSWYLQVTGLCWLAYWQCWRIAERRLRRPYLVPPVHVRTATNPVLMVAARDMVSSVTMSAFESTTWFAWSHFVVTLTEIVRKTSMSETTKQLRIIGTTSKQLHTTSPTKAAPEEAKEKSSWYVGWRSRLLHVKRACCVRFWLSSPICKRRLSCLHPSSIPFFSKAS